MTICILSREYPPETAWGGIGVYTYNLAHGLAQRGHAIHVICESLRQETVVHDDTITIHRIMNKPFFKSRTLYPEFMNRFEYSRCVLHKIEELDAQHGFDIIEGPNFAAEAYLFAQRKTIPLVTRLHTSFNGIIDQLEWERTMDRSLSCQLEDSVILNSDLVVFSTLGNKKYVFDNMGVWPRSIKIIPLGIPLPRVHAKRAEKKEKTVLYVGRLERRKGVDVLMHAIPRVVEQIPEARFQIVGRDTFVTNETVGFQGDEGASYKNVLLRSIPEHYHKHIDFTGYITDRELSERYRDASVFVAPSRYESFGLIFVEAMAHGIPVIGSRVGGVPEVIAEGQTGMLISSGNHEECAQAIIELLTNDQKRHAMGARARTYVEEHFSIDLMASRVEEAYREVMRAS